MAKQRKPAIKNSFYSLYKDAINLILGLFSLCAVVFTGYYIINNATEEIMMLALGIISCIILTALVLRIVIILCPYVAFLLNQRRVPLLAEELKQLGINSVKEYVEYLEKLLYGHMPKEDIFIRIVINTYFHFFSKEEFILARPDGYGFKCGDVCIKKKDFDLIKSCKKYKKGFLEELQQYGIDKDSTIYTNPNYFKESNIVHFEELFDANFDIRDEVRVSSLQNEIKLSKNDYNDLYFEEFYRTFFADTWLEKYKK